MTNVQAEVDQIPMGQVSAPLNSTTFNLSLSTTNGGTSGRHTLTVAAAATKAFDLGARTVEFIPSVIPAAPIFIKWHTASVTSAASATNFDEILYEGKPFIQCGIMRYCTGYSIYSASSQTVYTIER